MTGIAAATAAAPAPASASMDAMSMLSSAVGMASEAVDDLFAKVKPKKARARRRPSTESVPAAPAASTDRMYAVLMTQKANGSFRLSPALEQWLGSVVDAVRRAAGEHGEEQVVTAVVIALLERDEEARRDEWRPAVRKARKWLQRSGVPEIDALALLEDRATAV